MLDGLMPKANSSLWLMAWKYLGSLMYTVLVMCSWTQYDGPSFTLSPSFIHLQMDEPPSVPEQYATIFLIHESYLHETGITTMQVRIRLRAVVRLPVIPNIFSTLWMWYCRRQALTKTQPKALSHKWPTSDFMTDISVSHEFTMRSIRLQNCNFLLKPHKHRFGQTVLRQFVIQIWV